MTEGINVGMPNAWRHHAVLIFGTIVSILWIFHQTYVEIFNFWWNYSSYNHCLLIVPIALFLIFEKRDQILATPPSVSIAALVFILVNSILWLVGAVLSVSVFQHIAAVGFIVGSIWGLVGNATAWVILFPLFYLYFGVPEGEVLVPYLRDVTAQVVVKLLRWSEIPVFMEGRYLTIPSGQFHVAKACSGINYLIATLAVGTVFAYLRFKSPYRRILFMLLAIGVPILANGIRAYGIVMIAHLSNYKYALGVDHFIYGWLFFGFVIFILFQIGNSFSDVDESNTDAVPHLSPEIPESNVTKAIGIAIVAVGIAASMPLAYSKLTWGDNHERELAFNNNDKWKLTMDIGVKLNENYLGEPEYLRGQYIGGRCNEPIDAEVIYYRGSGEVESQANNLIDEDRWKELSGPISKNIQSAAVPTVMEYAIRRGNEERLVWTWFLVGDVTTTSETRLKWLSFKHRLLGTSEQVAKVVISISLRQHSEPGGCLQDFVNTFQPLVKSS